jgi:hypothetical protein
MENLKIFIYNNNGQKIDERDYDLFEDIFDEITNHNISNQNDIHSVYIGKEFPPKDYIWDDSNKNWKDLNNNFLKIFIYNDTGELIREDLYSEFLTSYSDVYNYNNSNNSDQRLMYYGTQFPPAEKVWDTEISDWKSINNPEFNDEISTEEIPVEEIFEDDNPNLLKVFVYNTQGEKIKEEFYSSFLNIYDFVLNHNTSNPNDPYNIYPGTEFPPKGYKWSNDKGDWVELSLYEKYIKGQIDIPNDCVVINNIIVRKNLSILHKEGLFNILPTQKIDKELNIIVDKSKQELIDEGLMDWEEVYKYYYNEFKRKIDMHLDLYYFKYPKAISFQFADKTNVAKLWKSLTNEQRSFARTFNYQEFLLLISEFKDLNRDYTLDEIEQELDILSNKIIQKNSEIEVKLGSINNFFNSLYKEITEIKETRNFLKLFDFVASIENRISQWIKS